MAVLAGGTFVVRRGLDKNIDALDRRRKSLRQEAVDLESKISELQKELDEASSANPTDKPAKTARPARVTGEDRPFSGFEFIPTLSRRVGELVIVDENGVVVTGTTPHHDWTFMNLAKMAHVGMRVGAGKSIMPGVVFHESSPDMETLSHQIEELRAEIARKSRISAIEARKRRAPRSTKAAG